MCARRYVFARLEKLKSNDFPVTVEIQHNAIGDFFAFDNGRVGEPHIECVGLGIVDCLHGITFGLGLLQQNLA